MARPLATATARDVARVETALQHLRAARDVLSGVAKGDKAAEPPIAPQALARISATIASTEGALRHVRRCADKTRLAAIAAGTMISRT